MILSLIPRRLYMLYQLLNYRGVALAHGTYEQVLEAVELHFPVPLDHGYDGELLLDGELIATIKLAPADPDPVGEF